MTTVTPTDVLPPMTREEAALLARATHDPVGTLTLHTGATLDEQIAALQEAQALRTLEERIDEDARTLQALSGQGVLTLADMADAGLVLHA